MFRRFLPALCVLAAALSLAWGPAKATQPVLLNCLVWSVAPTSGSPTGTSAIQNCAFFSASVTGGTGYYPGVGLLDAGGNLIGVSGNPLYVSDARSWTLSSGSDSVTALISGTPPFNLTQLAGTSLAVPAAWGSTPSGNVLSANVNCIVGCSGSASPSDNAAFTAGTTTFNPIGGAVGASALTSGHMGAVAMDTGRNLFVNATEWAGSALGAPTAWGSAPSGNVIGTNTNVLAEPGAGATAAAVPSTAQYAGMNVSGNLVGMTGTANGLKVDGSAVTQPVSGTVTANAGTGAFTVAQATASSLNATVVGAGSAGTPSGGVVSIQGVTSGQAVPVSGSVSVTGVSGTPTQTTASVTTGSSTILASSTATSFIKLCVAAGAANGIWVNWAGAAAVQAAPSEYISPGQCDSWVKATGFLPTSALTAIASASVSASLIYY